MSANPFGRLSEFNHSQIRKYLNFFRGKRQSSLRALAQEFADVKHDRYLNIFTPLSYASFGEQDNIPFPLHKHHTDLLMICTPERILKKALIF